MKTNELDFARAFFDQDSQAVAPESKKCVPDIASLRFPPYTAQKRPVRIMLKSHLSEAAVYSTSRADVRSGGKNIPFRGRMLLEALRGKTAVKATVNNVRRKLSLPCTLVVHGDAHLLELGEKSYRGTLVVTAEKNHTISILNVLPVEDYLRGVVPLEIGRLKKSEIEALKAQAVAARTYTYKRMAENVLNTFDMLPTVADQVYGGANVEHLEADMAVLATKDLIMVYDDSVINAFYHSTCGGRTADVKDVWGGMEPCPYLRSVRDVDSTGKAYCSWSKLFTWKENWSRSQLSSIMRRFSNEGRLSKPYRGTVRKIKVSDRFSCGRIKSCTILSSGGSYLSGGDRIRFLMRRNTKSNPILFSSRFRIRISGNRVDVSGRGYGHGVGMCQVGAIGRARAGQNFARILKAYYSGIHIRTVTDSR